MFVTLPLAIEPVVRETYAVTTGVLGYTSSGCIGFLTESNIVVILSIVEKINMARNITISVAWILVPTRTTVRN